MESKSDSNSPKFFDGNSVSDMRCRSYAVFELQLAAFVILLTEPLPNNVKRIRIGLYNNLFKMSLLPHQILATTSLGK